MTDKAFVGLSTIDGVVSGPGGARTVTFLIDTGAQYSLLPQDAWSALGLRRMRTMTFELADLSRIERDISECEIELPAIEGQTPRAHTPVILGKPKDVALLGVVTLEELGLVFNPFDRSLRPMRVAPLMSVA